MQERARAAFTELFVGARHCEHARRGEDTAAAASRDAPPPPPKMSRRRPPRFSPAWPRHPLAAGVTGWSADHGRAYYCNAQLGKTQWAPTASPPPPPTASTAPIRARRRVTNGDTAARGSRRRGPRRVRAGPRVAPPAAVAGRGGPADAQRRRPRARRLRASLRAAGGDLGDRARARDDPRARLPPAPERARVPGSSSCARGRSPSPAPATSSSATAATRSFASRRCTGGCSARFGRGAGALVGGGRPGARRRPAGPRARAPPDGRGEGAARRAAPHVRRVRARGPRARRQEAADGGGRWCRRPRRLAVARRRWRRRAVADGRRSPSGRRAEATRPAIAGSAVVAAYPGADPAESAGDAEEVEPAAAAAPAAPEPPLPDGWRSQLDLASGVDFYVHDESGATQWQRPTDSFIFRSTQRTRLSSTQTPTDVLLGGSPTSTARRVSCGPHAAVGRRGGDAAAQPARRLDLGDVGLPDERARGTRAAASTASQPATSASSAARIVRPTRTTPTIIPLCMPGGSRDISASAAALPPASLSPSSAHLPPPFWPTWISSSVPSCALRKSVSRVSSVFSPRISSDAYGCCSVRHARATRGAGAGRSGSGRGGGAYATAGGGAPRRI